MRTFSKLGFSGLAALFLLNDSAAQNPYFPIYGWTNFVGEPGGMGTIDGEGGAARFAGPYSVAIDARGTLYVGDGNTIRRITSSGTVTTLAGSQNVPGSSDGTAAEALFNSPAGIALDNAGNLLIADSWNHTIRKVTPSGDVTTIAGSPGLSGSADGIGSAARFYDPTGVAVDGNGNLFVADLSNGTVRKVTPEGVVTTFAGKATQFGSTDGTGDAARFLRPDGLGIDSSNNVYVADSGNHNIRRITPDAVVTTIAGRAGAFGTADGLGTAALFYCPYAIAADGAGSLLVADSRNHTLRKIDSTGMVTTLAGSPRIAGSADGVGSVARFNVPSGVAMDNTGNLFVVDCYNYTIRKVTAMLEVTTFVGSAPANGSADGTNSAARFNQPAQMAADTEGNLFVADTRNKTIRRITAAGEVSTFAGKAGSFGSTDGTGAAARFNDPSGVAVDAAGNVFVADTSNHTIRKITPAGVVSTLAGRPMASGSIDGTSGNARFYNPSQAAVDNEGNVYVADRSNHTIRKVTPAAVVTTLAGSPGVSGSLDGAGASARFYFPYGVTVAGDGTIFVADTGNSTIRKVTSAGIVTTVAGSPGASGSDDGVGTAARFRSPRALTVDPEGNILVADTSNATIRKVTPSGVVTTIGGLARAEGGIEGQGTSARFVFPTGIAATKTGYVYVTDERNNNVWKGNPTGVFFYTSLEGLRFTAEGLQLTVKGLQGRGPVTIYVSTNPADWDVLLTQPPTPGTLQVIDPAITNSQRFYRAAERVAP